MDVKKYPSKWYLCFNIRLFILKCHSWLKCYSSLMCTDLQRITDARIISVPNRHGHLKYSPGDSFTNFRKNIAFSHQENKS